MGNVKITLLDKEYNVSMGTTLKDIAPSFAAMYKYPIILAKVNGQVKALEEQVTKDCRLEFLDLTSVEGSRAHINGLVYVVINAVKELYGYEKDVSVEHSIDKSLYMQTNFNISEESIELIKNKMTEIINNDLTITKIICDRLEIKEYYDSINDTTRSKAMNYLTDTNITLYSMGNLYDYFYSHMPTSTKVLKDFDLTYIGENGFVLQFPTVYHNHEIKPYEAHPKMFEVFRITREWAELVKIKHSVDLNERVSKGKIDDLIRINESLQSHVLLKVAKDITKKENSPKLILIAGPSSSGKTTTTRKLCMYLESYGLNTKIISMDDYFVDRDSTPIDENGNPDYECLEAVDLELFNDHISKLLNGEEVITPIYNFRTGIKEMKQPMKLEENEKLLIEGIHALDDKILTNIADESKYKIYISALTELNIDNHNRFSTTDNRLLRRIIRDNRTRGNKVEDTLKSWTEVRRGEEKYIFPFQDVADFTMNTALIYEIGVLKTYVEPLLYSVPPDNPYYEEAKRLINYLRAFLPIPSDAIPKDSILREFIGGSCFHE